MAEDAQSSATENQSVEVEKKDAEKQVDSEAVIKESGDNSSATEQAAAEEVDKKETEEPGAVADSALIAEIEVLKVEVKKYQEQAVRAQAESQNVRRRSEADVEKAHKFGIEKFAKELLPVIDNLERAVDAMPSEDDEAMRPLKEGVEMTLSMFSDGLAKFKVEAIDPEGQPFDPDHHQAMSMQENNEVEPNTVLMVMQKGYTLNGRLIRPALVAVSKEGPKQAAPNDTPKIDEQA